MSPASTPLVGVVAAFESVPADSLNPTAPTARPRPLTMGLVVLDFGGPPAARVVGVLDTFGRLMFRTLGRPATVRPDWN